MFQRHTVRYMFSAAPSARLPETILLLGRLHGVLPGIIQPEEDHSTVARQGQERKSINIAFWPRECHHSSSLCKAKPSVAPEETTKSDDGRPSYAEEW